jgi:hypothetical protein
MKNLIATFVVVSTAALGSVTASAATISFDEGAGSQNGTISYDGIGGALIGTGIDFYTVLGDGTPNNNGVVLTCLGCELNFSTGANISASSSSLVFAGGGTFTVTGELLNGVTSVANGTLVSGSFQGTPNATIIPGSAIFAGFGIDTKHQDLLNFYGITAADFTFANTAIALGSCTSQGGSGGFSCGVQDADLVNTSVVPLPAAAGLFGSALLGLVGAARRKRV